MDDFAHATLDPLDTFPLDLPLSGKVAEEAGPCRVRTVGLKPGSVVVKTLGNLQWERGRQIELTLTPGDVVCS